MMPDIRMYEVPKPMVPGYTWPTLSPSRWLQGTKQGWGSCSWCSNSNL